MQPQPQLLFRTCVPGTPPQFSVAIVLGSDDLRTSSVVRSILPISSGCALQSRATSPTTCGPAIEVPLQPNWAYVPPGIEERIETPGATTSGPIPPSKVEGPRL